MKIRPYWRVLPRVRVWSRGAYLAMRPRAGCFTSTSMLLALLILVAWVHLLHGQVSAVMQLHGRDASVNVGNPTTHALRVSMALYRDSVGVNPPLGDSIRAVRISPATFTLQPGASQVVRLRLGTLPKPGTVLRLTTTFTPPEDRATAMHLVLAVRYIVRVLAEAGP